MLRPAIVLGDSEVVLEHAVRSLQRVVELVALEHVVVTVRLVSAAELRVDRAADAPHRALAALDPDDHPFLDAAVVDSGDDPLREALSGRSAPHTVYDRGVASLSQFFRNPFAFLFERSSQEDRLAAYVMREHDRGRALEDILSDRYILNRTTPQQLERLLDNPDLVRALGSDTIETARTGIT